MPGGMEIMTTQVEAVRAEQVNARLTIDQALVREPTRVVKQQKIETSV